MQIGSFLSMSGYIIIIVVVIIINWLGWFYIPDALQP
jgi:hypothetical protein